MPALGIAGRQEVGTHGLEHLGVERRRGVVVEVDHGVGFQPAVRGTGRGRLPARPAETGWETCPTSISHRHFAIPVKTSLVSARWPRNRPRTSLLAAFS